MCGGQVPVVGCGGRQAGLHGCGWVIKFGKNKAKTKKSMRSGRNLQRQGKTSKVCVVVLTTTKKVQKVPEKRNERYLSRGPATVCVVNC